MTTPTVRRIPVQPLTREAFAPFGEVIGPGDDPPVTMARILSGGYARFGRQIGTPPEGFDREALEMLHLWDPKVQFSHGGESPGIRYFVTHPRPLEFHQIERHLLGSETYIPLGGRPYLVAVAPPNDLDNPEAVPDIDSFAAFYCDGLRGVNYRAATWHWAPFPLDQEEVVFVTLTRAKVRLDDMYLVDLRLQLGVSLELALPEGMG